MANGTKLATAAILVALLEMSNAHLLKAVAADVNALQEPVSFASQGGVLDLLIVARPNTAPILGMRQPVGWVYNICRRPSATANACPRDGRSSSAYGGTRLSMMPGDKLRIRLINELPPVPEAKHAQDVSLDLALNPTNLHTHGLIVEPRYPTMSRPTWGDNVFVVGFNAKNGLPQPQLRGMHTHGSITVDPIEYEIDIPANHPSGLFWFHPHVHGIALNQVSAGLAGIITIGNVGDYACEDSGCLRPWGTQNVRHLILKDAQIEADGTLTTQQDPQFCPQFPAAGDAPRLGMCAGQLVPEGGQDHTNGRWILSVNGQVYPTIPITTPLGEVWRITNASGSASYDLHVWNDVLQQDTIFQVVSVDGVSVTTATGASVGQLGVAGATKIRTADCPSTNAGSTVNAPALCATSVRMMPSSRVEIHVVYRDANGHAVSAPVNSKLVLRTTGFDTGGDQWPAVDLAEVRFNGAGAAVRLNDTVHVRGQAAMVHDHTTSSVSDAQSSHSSIALKNCKAPLPAGHRRRIYFGVPAGTEDGFGLGYEEIDQSGRPVPGSFVDITSFSPDTTIICLPLAAGNKPAKEVWELVNVANEDHNFHIHQTKFRVLEGQTAQPSQRTANVKSKGASSLLPFPKAAVLHDNIPLPADPACDGSIASWRGPSATCQAMPVVIEIAFSQVGDFVYHCHILEHEDGGMMAKITVIGRP